MPKPTIPLPYLSFQECVACYSVPTLQYVTEVLEGLIPQLSCHECHVEWAYTYLYRAWQPWPEACKALHRRCRTEQVLRGLTPEVVDRGLVSLGPYEMPYWVGWPLLQQQHRETLMFFGLVEQLRSRAEALYPTTGAREDFYDNEGFRTEALLYQAPPHALLGLDEMLDHLGAPPGATNFYDQYNWGVEPEVTVTVSYPYPKDEYYYVA